MNAYETVEVDTPAGVYTVELHQDEDAENPLTSWDQPGMAFYIEAAGYGGSTSVVLDTLDATNDAGSILSRLIARDEYRYGGIDVEGVERRFSKWRAIADSPWVLVTGEDSASQSDYYRWYVLVDSSEPTGGDYYYPDPQQIAHVVMADYRTWASDEVCGFITKAPDGEVVESVWGFYDNDEAMQGGKDAAEGDALDRIDAGNRAGAGFVGII